MKKTRLMAAMAAVIGGALMASVSVHAQTTPLEVWQPQQGEVDPAKRVPQTSQPAPEAEAASQPAASPHYMAAPTTPAAYQQNRGGFFIGAQAGKGWVYDNVDQSALMVNAGYRWQAGAVTLVGIEVAGGQLDGTTKYDYSFGSVDLLSVGANARFNFGQNSPVYALVRGGYWSADNEYGGNIDGGYAGVGLGVDFNRNFNMSVIYTNYVYFSDYTYDYDYEDISRADTLMLGAEIRF